MIVIALPATPGRSWPLTRWRSLADRFVHLARAHDIFHPHRGATAHRSRSPPRLRADRSRSAWSPRCGCAGRRLDSAARRHPRRHRARSRSGPSTPACRRRASTTWHRLGELQRAPWQHRQIRRWPGHPRRVLTGVITGVMLPPALRHPVPPTAVRPRPRRCHSPSHPAVGQLVEPGALRAGTTCRGRSRSTTSACPGAPSASTPTAPPSTRPSSTSRCGLPGCAGVLIVSTTGPAAARRSDRIYLGGYGIGRLVVESLRIDAAQTGRRAARQPVGGDRVACSVAVGYVPGWSTGGGLTRPASFARPGTTTAAGANGVRRADAVTLGRRVRTASPPTTSAKVAKPRAALSLTADEIDADHGTARRHARSLR